MKTTVLTLIVVIIIALLLLFSMESNKYKNNINSKDTLLNFYTYCIITISVAFGILLYAL